MQAYAGVEKHVAELERMQRHIAPHQIEIDRMNAFAGQTKDLRANVNALRDISMHNAGVDSLAVDRAMEPAHHAAKEVMLRDEALWRGQRTPLLM